ncbi:unnamed protein product [Arctogadus glacialis]
MSHSPPSYLSTKVSGGGPHQLCSQLLLYELEEKRCRRELIQQSIAEPPLRGPEGPQVGVATGGCVAPGGCGQGQSWSQVGVAPSGCGPRWVWPQVGVAPDGCGPRWVWSQVGVAPVLCVLLIRFHVFY